MLIKLFFFLLFINYSLLLKLIYNEKFSNDFDYMRKRDSIMENMEKIYNYNYSSDELIVNNYLNFLKWKEKMEDMEKFGRPSASIPIEKIIKKIKKRKIYEILKQFPKGGDLHSHEDHHLSRRTLFEIIWNNSDFKYLHLKDPEKFNKSWKLDFFVNPPSKDWIKVDGSKYKMDEILNHHTLLSRLTPEASHSPTDSDLRWKLINPLWDSGCVELIANIKIKRLYLKAVYEQSLSEMIIYIETRKGLGFEELLYEMNESLEFNSTYGKKYLDKNYELEVKLAMEVINKFQKTNPEFVDHKRISYSPRFFDMDLFNKILNTTINLRQKFPNHVIGFDLVAEEDKGYAHLKFLESFLSLNKRKIDMPLFLHTAETSWPEDLISSDKEDDLVATLANTLDAFLLGAVRLGHGKGVEKFPLLMQLLTQKGVAVEVCPISNQILGMDPDLRNHFGQILHKRGMPIVLAPDDPGTFGTDEVTLDWYMAFTGWGLKLGDLKKIASNSLIYSALNSTEKKFAYGIWENQWKNWILKMKNEACSRNFTKEAQESKKNLTFSEILPKTGKSGDLVHIYGRNFEIGICKTIKCKFQNKITKAIYKSNNELICFVPDCNDCKIGLIQIFLDFGNHDFIPTNLFFSFVKSFNPGLSSRL